MKTPRKTPRPTGRPPGPSLATVSQVRKEVASTYRLMRIGELAPDHARKRCYVLLSLARLIETSDMEARLAALEPRLAQLERRGPKLRAV